MPLLALQFPLMFLYPAICGVYRTKLNQKLSEMTAILDAHAENRQLYQQAFGRSPELLFKKSFTVFSYAVPMLINTAMVWALSIGVLIRTHLISDGGNGLATFLSGNRGTAIVAATCGAFVWGMYDALRRYADTSLTPEALHFTWLRMLIAAAVAPFVGFLFNEQAGSLIAFGVGAFPTKTLQDFIKAQVTKKLEMKTQSDPVEPPTLQCLQGGTESTIEMLKEVGVDSVHHLAFADPLRLFMRTNLPWKVILDLIDQALLFVYIGDNAARLRTMGTRGAIELSTVQDQLNDSATHQVGANAVKMIAGLLVSSEEAVENLALTLYEDYQVQFISSLWGGAFERVDVEPLPNGD